MLVYGHLLTDPHRDPPAEPGWLRVEESDGGAAGGGGGGGVIAEVGFGDPPDRPDLGGPDRIICPGFVDAHLHFPQIDSIGYDGLPLLAWLEQVIYPAESAWIDPALALLQTHKVIARLLAAGTTGCAAYLTCHDTGLPAARQALAQRPIRAIVGRVIMDRIVDAECSASAAAPPLSAYDIVPDDASDFDSERFGVSVNPRFAVACSAEALDLAGRIATGPPRRFVQTHLAESVDECAKVRQLFPDAPHYAGVYDRFGLLHDRTLLAHAVHLCDDEWSLIAERDAVVVHCPTANTFLCSGLFDLDAARAHGVRIALGSDIAAGPDVSMPRVARAMIETAKVRRQTVAPDAFVPTAADVWDLITRGNAEALGWQDHGRLEVGAAADLLVLRLPDDSIDFDDHLVSRLLYTWSDDYIEHVILASRAVRV